MKGKIVLILLTIGMACKAQTYESPAMQQQAAREMAAKNAVLNIKPVPAKAERKMEDADAQAMPDIKGYYHIVSIDAVNFSHKYSEAQQGEYKKEAKTEFELNNFYLNPEKTLIIKVNRKTGRISSFNLKMIENKLVFVCGTCNIPSFVIESAGPASLILLQAAQDSNQLFDFKYEFKQ